MFSFDANEEKEFTNELPEARYLVTIAEAQYKPSKSNPNNTMVALKYVINDTTSDHNGWTIYDNFNVVNSNDIAQKIGRSDLKKMCESCDVIKFDDVNELCGAELIVDVNHKVYQGKKSPNVVGYYAPTTQETEIPFG